LSCPKQKSIIKLAFGWGQKADKGMLTMKKQMKIAVMVFVAAICAPSYGDIIVYKFTGQYNPYVQYDDDSYTVATVNVVKVTGYVVVDVNLRDDSFNYTPYWIFYDTKTKTCYYGEADETSYFSRYDIKGTAKKEMYLYLSFVLVGGYWDCTFYGACSEVSTGGAYKILMPKSLKGVMVYMSSSSPVADGIGNAALSLDLKYTRNGNEIGATQASTANRILADLQAKGYGS
jgi:hypothetical protein